MTAPPFSPRGRKRDIEAGSDFAPLFGPDGLIPCIVTDQASGQVLMFAFMNAETLEMTLNSGVAHFWSRSRGTVWKKGETSGEWLKVEGLLTDCDQDVLWLKVTPQGRGATCHTGRVSCFYRQVVPSNHGKAGFELADTGIARRFDPRDVYGDD